MHKKSLYGILLALSFVSVASKADEAVAPTSEAAPARLNLTASLRNEMWSLPKPLPPQTSCEAPSITDWSPVISFDKALKFCGQTQPTPLQNFVRACKPGDNGCKPSRAYHRQRPKTWESNLCLNRLLTWRVRDACGRNVDYSLMGRNDGRAYKIWNDGLQSITHVVVHNGGYTPEQNSSTWETRSAGAHFTIARDGRIAQHIGIERTTIHAARMNGHAIGIELNIDKTPKGESCNNLHQGLLRQKGGTEIVRNACAPTPQQYASLRALINGLIPHTKVQFDEEHIVGHCESEDNAGKHAHADPRAFDWQQIGLSNNKKRTLLAKKNSACWFRLLTSDKPTNTPANEAPRARPLVGSATEAQKARVE